MEIKQVEIMKLGNIVYVMALEPHDEVWGVEDGGKDVGIVDRVIGNNICGSGSWEDSETRVDKHNEMQLNE